MKDETKFEKSKEKPKKQEKDMKEMYIQKKKRKKQIIILSIIIIVVALFVSTIFAFVNINNDKIMSGISIAGIDMSGLSKEEATAKLELIYNEKKEKDINLIYDDYELLQSGRRLSADALFLSIHPLSEGRMREKSYFRMRKIRKYTEH